MLPYDGPDNHKDPSKSQLKVDLWNQMFQEPKDFVFLLYEQDGNNGRPDPVNPDTFDTKEFIKKNKFKKDPVGINSFKVPKSKIKF